MLNDLITVTDETLEGSPFFKTPDQILMNFLRNCELCNDASWIPLSLLEIIAAQAKIITITKFPRSKKKNFCRGNRRNSKYQVNCVRSSHRRRFFRKALVHRSHLTAIQFDYFSHIAIKPSE